MNLGILGGTFNPPHTGHLLLAECARVECALDAVLFIPAYLSPFKKEQPAVGAEIRAEMVELAVSDNRHFQVSLSEVRRRDVSYTVDTLRELREQRPQDSLVLILGADAFKDFPLWMHPEQVVQLARIAVAIRPGFALDLDAHPFGQYATPFPMPLIDISASVVRARVRAGKSIQYLVPWTVLTFIEANGLYR